jgi:hypothetical protein
MREEWAFLARRTLLGADPHSTRQVLRGGGVVCGRISVAGNVCGTLMDEEFWHCTDCCAMEKYPKHEEGVSGTIEICRAVEIPVSRRAPIPYSLDRCDITIQIPGERKMLVDFGSYTAMAAKDLVALRGADAGGRKRNRRGAVIPATGKVVAALVAAEQKKTTKYKAACAAVGYDFVPLVISTFGGGATGAQVALLKPLQKAVAKAAGVDVSVAQKRVMAAIQIPMMRRIAQSGLRSLAKIRMVGQEREAIQAADREAVLEARGV